MTDTPRTPEDTGLSLDGLPSEHLAEFADQHYAKLAKSFHTDGKGRGVLVIFVDDKSTEPEYFTLEQCRSQPGAKQAALTTLVERYDPTREGVLLYVDGADTSKGVRGPMVVTIQTTH